jgi:hypothetical protein
MPSASQQPERFRAAELGLKLTSGFEILWARAARVGGLPGQLQRMAAESDAAAAAAAGGDGDGGGSTAAAAPAAGAADGAAQQQQPGAACGAERVASVMGEAQLRGLPAWRAYVGCLDRSGYFEGNIAGSARWGARARACTRARARTHARTRTRALLHASPLSVLSLIDLPNTADGGHA